MNRNKLNIINKKQTGGVGEFASCTLDAGKNDTKIYYIPMEKCQHEVSENTVQGYTFEKKIFKPDTFTGDLESILSNCLQSNIMIFFSSYKGGTCSENKKYTGIINDSLEKFVIKKPSERLLNVVIIHLADKVDNVIFKINVNGKRYFKKVINILPETKAIMIDTKLKDVYDELLNNRVGKSSTTINYDVYKKYGFPDLPAEAVKSNITRQIVINHRVIDEKANKFNETWWFKYYMESPYCLYYRLFQSSGTCWMNATLNLFLLLPPIANILVKKFNEYPDRKKLEDLTYSDIKKNNKEDEEENKYIKRGLYNFTECMYIIVNQLLVKKNKPNYYEGDIVLNIAQSLKQESTKNTDVEGEGGNTMEAVLFIIDKLGLYDEVNCIDLNYNKGLQIVSQSKKYFPKEGEPGAFMVESRNVKALLDYNENVEKKYKLYTHDENKNVLVSSDLFSKSDRLYSSLTLNKKSQYLDDEHLGYYLSNVMEKVENKKNVLFVVGNMNSNNIRIRGYILIGCVLNTKTHAIMGLKCMTDNNFYIYDSNNIIAQTKWNKNKYDAYYEKRDAGSAGQAHERIGNINNTTTLVYVKA